MPRRFAVAIAVLALVGSSACNRSGPSPDPAQDAGVVYHNAVVITMDDRRPRAEAFEVRGDRLHAVGSLDEVLAGVGPQPRMVDLGGATVVPGFIDAHGHRVNNRFGEAGLASNADSARAAVEQGWTGVHELFADEVTLDLIRDLEAAGQLPLRVDAYLPVNSPQLDPYDPWYMAYQPRQMLAPHLRVAGLKFFVDRDTGTVIGWTADELADAFEAVQQQGWQVAAKSIGTATLDVILDAVEAVPGGPDRRYRIEHILAVTPAQMTRLRDLGAVAILQTNIPGQLVGEADIEAFIAREPPGSYAPWRSLHSAGVRVAGGTGWPSYYVDEPAGPPFASPLRLLYQAVTRTGAHGGPPEAWMLAEAITVEQAMRAYTLGSAEAAFTEADRGSLTPGKLADFVVLSGNPLDVPVEQILRTQVRATFVGGVLVFCDPSAGHLCTGAQPQPSDPELPRFEHPALAILGPASGQHAALGPALRNAVELAIEELGGGLALELTLVDEKCTEAGGTAAAAAVTGDPDVVAVLGPACSAAAFGALPALQAAGIPAVSGGATEPGLGALGPTVFSRTVPADGVAPVEAVNSLAAVADFYARYTQRYGALPAQLYRPYLAYTYDAAGVLIQALAATASVDGDGSMRLDRAALAVAIRATSGYQGITGVISIDADGDRTG